MVCMSHKLASNGRQKRLYLALSDRRSQGEFFGHFLIQDQSDWGMQDELGRPGTPVQGQYMSWGQAKGGGMDSYCFLWLPPPCSLNHTYPLCPGKQLPANLFCPLGCEKLHRRVDYSNHSWQFLYICLVLLICSKNCCSERIWFSELSP